MPGELCSGFPQRRSRTVRFPTRRIDSTERGTGSLSSHIPWSNWYPPWDDDEVDAADSELLVPRAW